MAFFDQLSRFRCGHIDKLHTTIDRSGYKFTTIVCCVRCSVGGRRTSTAGRRNRMWRHHQRRWRHKARVLPKRRRAVIRGRLRQVAAATTQRRFRLMRVRRWILFSIYFWNTKHV